VVAALSFSGKTRSVNLKNEALQPMFRINRFQAIFRPLPQQSFERIVAEHGADKHSKGFSCWHQLLALVYAQLSNASSLRTLEAGFNSNLGGHYHLGARPVRRSTLAEALGKRSPDVFAQAARLLMTQAKRSLRRDAGELLYLLDSTAISLKGQGFDNWAPALRSSRIQGLKLHLLMSNTDSLPLMHSITPAKVNDVSEGVKLPLEPGAVYVFDKGYCDYSWWHRMQEAGSLFVTRFKRNAALALEQTQPLDPQVPHILADEWVRFNNRKPGGGRQNPYRRALRCITVAREGKTPLVLATNDMHSPAALIAQRYQQRWGIELFFKWIKQHLRIKSFLGRSETAVHTQILTALIAYLLLHLLGQAQGSKQSLWMLLAQLRMGGLFVRPETDISYYRRRRQEAQALAQVQAVLSP
jgi:IS4 transposase